MAPRPQSGFTWIELLMVVAVIAILALMAIPSLQEQALKRQVKEGMTLADVAKKNIQAYWSLTGEMPRNNEVASLPPANKIVSTLVKEVFVKDGAITLVFGNNAHKGLDGKKLTIRPAVVPGEAMVPIAWICANVQVPRQMEAMGSDETDIQMSWLPVDCRGAADPTKK